MAAVSGGGRVSIKILIGECRQQLQMLPAQSVHTVVTSPPYWGLRDYGIPGVDWADRWHGVYGLEPTIEQYLTHTLEIFGEIERVLRDDGVIWWNIGDTYSAGGRGSYDGTTGNRGNKAVCNASRAKGVLPDGNKCLIPARVAIALQEAGWVVRQDVIWVKPSPMPESVQGWRWERCKNECPGCSKCAANGGYVLRQGRWRPTTAHEAIFLITKPGNYVCHALQVAEKAVGNHPGQKEHKGKKAYEAGDRHLRTKVGLTECAATDTRNPRSTWRIAPESYTGAHFATFPSELPYRCIKAATSDKGCCPHCGDQWVAIEDKTRRPTRPGNQTKVGRVSDEEDSPYHGHAGMIVGNRDPQRHITVNTILGYRPTCTCPEHEPVPCTVLDPFVGSGTTLQVAEWTGRHGIGIELGEQNQPLIEERIAKEPAVLRRLKEKQTGKKPQRRKKQKQQRELFAS